MNTDKEKIMGEKKKKDKIFFVFSWLGETVKFLKILINSENDLCVRTASEFFVMSGRLRETDSNFFNIYQNY